MTLIDSITKEALAARKAAMKNTDPEIKAHNKMVAELIVGIQGDIKAIQKSSTKDGKMPDIDDETCMRALRSALKGQEETLRLIEEAGQINRVEEVKMKISTIKGLMPEVASEEEVRQEIQNLINKETSNGLPKGFMGVIMKELNSKFGTSLDRSMASRLAKEMLS